MTPSIGIPPLNLSAGPTTQLGQADGRNTGHVTAGTGPFAFGGSTAQNSMWPLIIASALVGAVIYIRGR